MSKLFELIEKPLTGEWGEEDDDGTGIPVLRTTNFTQIGDINFDNVVTRKVGFNKAKSKFLKKGDIIIEKSGGSEKQPVGRVVFFVCCVNNFLFFNLTSNV
jgi:type I restriction enzyme S subunit